jgi:hypothetical protein
MIRFLFYLLVAYLLFRFIRTVISVVTFIKNVKGDINTSQKRPNKNKDAVEMKQSEDGSFHYTQDS